MPKAIKIRTEGGSGADKAVASAWADEGGASDRKASETKIRRKQSLAFMEKRKKYFASFNAIDIEEIEPIKQQVVISGFLSLFWRDKRLWERIDAELDGKLDDNMYTDGSYVKDFLPPDDGLMLPVDIHAIFANQDEMEIASSGCSFAHHAETGQTALSIKFKATLEQPIRYHRFPFERVQVSLQLKNTRKNFELSPKPFAWMKQNFEEANPKIKVFEAHLQPFKASLSPVVDQLYIVHKMGAQFCKYEGDCTVILRDPRLYMWLERKPGFYISSIMLPCFFFGGLTCACFSISMPDLADRLALSVTVLLTIVALKLVTASDLPKISYMTFLDYYYFGCALFIGLIMAACVVIAEWFGEDTDVRQDLDRILRVGFPCSWILMHVIMALGIWRKWWFAAWTNVDDVFDKRKGAHCVKFENYDEATQELLLEEDDEETADDDADHFLPVVANDAAGSGS